MGEHEHTAVVTSGTRSADGTMISYHRMGRGRPLVVVPGSLDTGMDWLQVAELLHKDFTLYLVNRRGRAATGSMRTERTLENEYEDVAAVLRCAGRSAVLLGHSYGAIVALGTALQMAPADLVLYEPPLPVAGPVAGASLSPYTAAVAAGRFDDALTLGMTDIVHVTVEELAALRAMPALWAKMAALTPTWIPELSEIDRLGPSLERYRSLACPTLLLVGEFSAAHPLRTASQQLATILRDCRTVQLDGQAHSAHKAAPQQLAQVLQQFRGTSPRNAHT